MPTAARTSKKKAAAAAATPTPVVEPVPEPVAPAPAPEPVPAKKKAAKKPVKVIAVVTPNGIEGSFTPEPRRPLIAHLQIKTNEVMFHDSQLRYDPNPPKDMDVKPYDAAETDFFLEGAGTTEKASEEPAVEAVAEEEVVETRKEPVAAIAVPKPMPCFAKADLMVQYRDMTEEKQLPDRTDIACFWCAHTFEWRPCVIPEREVGGVYNVYGNFCTPQCGVAYLLSESLDPHVRWERMALLHRIYDNAGKGRIFPAPARESLKLFGGPMSIETYRATMSEGAVRVDVHMPPMVSILGSIDTKPIDFFDTSLRQGAGGAVAPQLPKPVEGGLRLKRTKPLKDRESTLDTVMNIQISSGRRRAVAAGST
jgi:hypothetical protein